MSGGLSAPRDFTALKAPIAADSQCDIEVERHFPKFPLHGRDPDPWP